MKKSTRDISNKQTACYGALIAIAATFFYALLVMVYAIIRTSSFILQVMPAGEHSGILWANGIALVYSIASFSLLMAVISSFTGAIVALVLRKLLLWLNPECSIKKTVVICFLLAVLILSIFYFLLFSLLRDRISFQYPETLFFWFVFPAMIYLFISIPAGKALNKVNKRNLMLLNFYHFYV